MMWEYKIIREDTINKLWGNSVQPLLEELGKQGWELIWIDKTDRLTLSLLVFGTKLHTEKTFYFKRLINVN